MLFAWSERSSNSNLLVTFSSIWSRDLRMITFHGQQLHDQKRVEYSVVACVGSAVKVAESLIHHFSFLESFYEIFKGYFSVY